MVLIDVQLCVFVYTVFISSLTWPLIASICALTHALWQLTTKVSASQIIYSHITVCAATSPHCQEDKRYKKRVLVLPSISISDWVRRSVAFRPLRISMPFGAQKLLKGTHAKCNPMFEQSLGHGYFKDCDVAVA